MDPLQVLIAASTGLGLAAASGFRVFLPPFLMAVWLRLGFLDVNIEGSEFEAFSSDVSILLLGVASLSEIMAYKIPWMDNMLDSLATPMAGLAGIYVVAVSLEGADPSVQWALAIIAGGGASLSIQSATVAGRGLSSMFTLGLANPFFSLIEDIASVLLIFIALLAPLAALFASSILIFVILRRKMQDPTDHPD
ncbi:MAG: hypothetical protein CMA31_03980 [Euryarchaeota archaeon]|nr:hypothetical protein [Euryarchaeota archaeon]RPG70987.1 MAG: DUF4126 domain-containing protein [Euryarchaeota archaeon TMED192]|tara:strand:- start:1287 stop:1868 length:582 start_codon:yes stop_codon:yes gene_type:complete